ncbi:MAG: hypothetical protein IJR13_09805 [Bacteroidales bacterium]|nr:hypothetical protein [Bacteroidales bacterium]
MKKISLLFVTAAMLLGLSSCDKEKKEDASGNTSTPLAEIVAGTYSGWTKADAAYFSNMVNDEVDQLAITANSDGTVNVEYTSDTWGKGVFNNIAIAEVSDKYTFAGEGTITMASRGGTKDYEGTFEGSVSKDMKSYTVKIVIPSVMGGTTLTLNPGMAPVNMVVAGQYAGWSSAVFSYAPNGMNNDGDTLRLSANADGTVNVAYTSATWGNGTFENVVVARSEEGYTLSEMQGVVAMASRNGEVKEYEVVLKASTIAADKRSFRFNISVPSVMGGVEITVSEGTAPAEE